MCKRGRPMAGNKPYTLADHLHGADHDHEHDADHDHDHDAAPGAPERDEDPISPGLWSHETHGRPWFESRFLDTIL